MLIFDLYNCKCDETLVKQNWCTSGTYRVLVCTDHNTNWIFLSLTLSFAWAFNLHFDMYLSVLFSKKNFGQWLWVGMFLKKYTILALKLSEFLISHCVFCRNFFLTSSLQSSSKVYTKVNKPIIYLLIPNEADLQEHKRDIAKRDQSSVFRIVLVS